MPKVLVAEDEKALSHALELKLASAGFTVTVVGDGAAALEAISKEKFDILLLDLMMPVKDGFGVLKELEEKKIHIPAVVLSNLSQTEDEKKVRELGAVDFWIKAEISLVEVVNRVKKLLDMPT